ncbi:MAG TPA: hypothetical protein PLK44_02980 [Aestuariivirga sp.]|nr:hypothetical protein [Aestuariivirga sp.]
MTTFTAGALAALLAADGKAKSSVAASAKLMERRNRITIVLSPERVPRENKHQIFTRRKMAAIHMPVS